MKITYSPTWAKTPQLVEYGIMTSTRSSAVKERLDQLMLIEGEDYLLQDVLQQVKSGTKHSKHYHLTHGAFKICLMRAQRKLTFFMKMSKISKMTIL